MFRFSHFCGLVLTLTLVTRGILAADAPAKPDAPKATAADEAVKKQMGDKKISFEFVEKPLKDALADIAKAAEVKIVLSPAAEKLELPPITLRVKDMSADLALRWTLKLADMVYRIENGQVIVDSPKL